MINELLNIVRVESPNILIFCIVMLLDFITGIVSAVKTKHMDSKVGKRGIPNKLLNLCVIILACVIQYVLGTQIPIAGTVTLFYTINESISVLENVAKAGGHIPAKLKNILQQLKDKNDKQEE